MEWKKRASSMVALVVAMGLGIPGAQAYEVYSDEDVSVGLGVFGQAHAGAELRSYETDDYGFALDFARAKMTASYADTADVALQIGGASGDVVVKDIVATLRPIDGIGLRAGRFKTSVSVEYLRSATDLPFVGRALISDVVPNRRVGGELVGRTDLDEVELVGQVGLFQPRHQQVSFQQPRGQLLTGRVTARLPVGLGVHVGYGQHILEQNEFPGGRAEAFDQQLDVGVTYDDDRLDVHLEGLTVFDPPGTDELFGGYAHALYAFGPEEGFQVEPGIGYDIVAQQRAVHRGTVGVNLHWWEAPIDTMIDYRYQTLRDRGTHSILVALRAGEL